jgi:RNA recognition motif-containing protein
MGGISNNTQRDEDHMKKARIFVGNVDSNNISRSDLISVFSKHGDVVAVSIHAGYSFIQMDSERSANRAINYEHGATINGRKINVEFSTAALKAGARCK